MVCEGANIHGPIFITKVEGRGPCEAPCCVCLRGHFEGVRTININNLRDLTMDQNTPVESTPLPESRDSSAIMVKAFGNHTTINVTWCVVCEPSNVVRQTLSGTEVITTCNIGVACTSKPESIVKYWLNIFQSDSIQDVYNLYIGDCFAAACANRIPNITPTSLTQEGKFGFNPMCCNNFNCAIAYHKTGVLSNVRFIKTGVAPVTYTGSFTFKVGDAVASPEECNA